MEKAWLWLEQWYVDAPTVRETIQRAYTFLTWKARIKAAGVLLPFIL